MAKENHVQARMPLAAALEELAQQRTNEIVVTTMGAAREWPKHSQHPLDFHYLPSAMGHAPMLGLGLVTCAAGQRARNRLFQRRRLHADEPGLVGDDCRFGRPQPDADRAGERHLRSDRRPNNRRRSGRQVDFAGVARAAGIPTVLDFDRAGYLARSGGRTALASRPSVRGITRRAGRRRLSTSRPRADAGGRIARFRETLETASGEDQS